MTLKIRLLFSLQNIGAKLLIEKGESGRSEVMDLLKHSFRPEFLNRLDEILIFNKLSKESLKEIVSVQIDYLQSLMKDKRITLNLDDKAKMWLAENGFDAVYGARPLKRLIQKEIQNEIAKMILSGTVMDGSAINITEHNNKLILSV